jgi:hypothetical protein
LAALAWVGRVERDVSGAGLESSEECDDHVEATFETDADE